MFSRFNGDKTEIGTALLMLGVALGLVSQEEAGSVVTVLKETAEPAAVIVGGATTIVGVFHRVWKRLTGKD